MKKLYFLLVILCISLQSLYSVEFDKSKLSKLQGTNNWGEEFYFNFLPFMDTNGAAKYLKIFIVSNEPTNIHIEVPGKGYSRDYVIAPNSIFELTSSQSFGEPYPKVCSQKPNPDEIYKSAGIHITSDNPILINCISDYRDWSEGFQVLPVNLLGKEYIISSFADCSNNNDQWYPSMFAVTAAYDDTKVSFTMGGTDWSKTVSGQLSGERTSWNLNAGDVLMVSSSGTLSDLSGSVINADKPISVIAGNYYACIPSNFTLGNPIIETQIPTEFWGKYYHVTPIITRKKNSIIRIYAKEVKTNVYRDNILIGYLKTRGGILGKGFLEMRADEGEPRPILISGDKPISVTQYNTSMSDDNYSGTPFQLSLIPVEQYKNEFTFFTPGIKYSFWFNNNYINLCFATDSISSIPDDIDMAFYNVKDSIYQWYRLKDSITSNVVAFSHIDSNMNFSFLSLKLPELGIYKIRSKRPLQAYQYGFTDQYSFGYAYPAEVSLKKIYIIDTLPPVPEWSIDCLGFVNFGKAVWVTDKPDNPENRSNLSSITLQSDLSYNYELYYGDFMPCEDYESAWRLDPIDPREDAMGVVTFTDCAGNDTTIVIEYESRKLGTNPDMIQFENAKVANHYNQQIILKNITATREYYIRNISLADGTSGFSLYDSIMNPIVLSLQMLPQDSIIINIKFSPEIDGFFRDTILISDSCVIYKKIPIVGFTEGTTVESNENQIIQIYPNPTEDILIIDKLPMNTSKVQIFDESGKGVRSIDIKNQSESLKISTKDLPVGAYILRLFVGSEVLDKKFVVVK